MLHQQALEILQIRINNEFDKLELPYYIRIDDYSILSEIFEYAIFVYGEETKRQAHEIAENLLKNSIFGIF